MQEFRLTTPPWKEKIQLTDLQHAIVTTTAVVMGLILAEFKEMGMMTGFFVVAIQNASGLNAAGSFRERVNSCLISGGIMTGTAFLSVLSTSSLSASITGAVILSFCMARWYQRFPAYWGSVNIPSAVIYFMTLSLKNSHPVLPVFAGVVLGTSVQIAGIALLGFFGQLKIAPDESNAPVALPSAENPEPKGVHSFYEAISYGLQLLVLLNIAVLVLHLSGYPHAYWMAFTIAIVLKINFRDTKKFTLHRIFGTVLGCIIGSILLLFHINGVVYLMLVGFNIFIFTYLSTNHYFIAVIFITIFVLLLIGHGKTQQTHVAIERVAFTIAGGLMTFFVSLTASEIFKKFIRNVASS